MTITFLLFPADNLDSVKVQFYISGSILDIYIALIFRKYSKKHSDLDRLFGQDLVI